MGPPQVDEVLQAAAMALSLGPDAFDSSKAMAHLCRLSPRSLDGPSRHEESLIKRQ